MTFGQKFRLIASLISVKLPLISAWLAMMDAAIAMNTLGIRNQCGTIAKKGLTPPILSLCCSSTQAP